MREGVKQLIYTVRPTIRLSEFGVSSSPTLVARTPYGVNTRSRMVGLRGTHSREHGLPSAGNPLDMGNRRELAYIAVPKHRNILHRPVHLTLYLRRLASLPVLIACDTALKLWYFFAKRCDRKSCSVSSLSPDARMIQNKYQEFLVQ